MPGTVTVGCRLPAGLHLPIFRMQDIEEPLMNSAGVRKTKIAVPIGRITIKGTGRRVDDPRVIYGAALTPDVDADTFAKWLEDNKDSDLVRKGLVFAHAKPAEVSVIARERENERSGLEPIDPANLPPEFKRKIEAADKPGQG